MVILDVREDFILPNRRFPENFVLISVVEECQVYGVKKGATWKDISTDYYISWVWDATGCFWTTSNQIYNFALGRHKSILKDFQIFSGDFNGWPGVPIHK